MCEIEKLNTFFIDYDDTIDSLRTTYCCKLARQQFSISVLKEKGLQFIIDQTYNNGKITESGYEGACNLSCELSKQPSEIYVHAIHKCKSIFFEIIKYIKKLEYETSIIIDGSDDIFSYYPDLIEYLKTLKIDKVDGVTYIKRPENTIYDIDISLRKDVGRAEW